MAAGRIIFPGFMPCEDANGDRVPGARAYFYLNGTATLTQVYADDDLVTPLPNPVVADAVGTWPEMWADTTLQFSVALAEGDGTPLPGGVWSGLGPAIDATLASVALALAAQTAAQIARAGAEAAEAKAEALLASATGEPFRATSLSANTIGVGAKTFVLQEPGKLFGQGQILVSAYTGGAKNQMIGVATTVVTDPDTEIQTITLDVPAGMTAAPDGAGPYASWSIALATMSGVASVAGLAGVISAAAAKAALAITSADITNFDTATDERAINVAAAMALVLGRRR